MLQLPLKLLSPHGARGRLSILIFHRVLPRPDPLLPEVPDAAWFEEQMNWVRHWFNVMPLAAAAESLFAGTLPARALAITFDDGYADNEELAAPILSRLGLHATFFVSTGFLSGGCMWNDRIIEAVRSCGAPELDLTRIGLGVVKLEPLMQRRGAVVTLLDSIKHMEPDERSAAVAAIVEVAQAGPAPDLMMQPAQIRRMRQRGMDVGAHTVSHPILTRLSPAAARGEIGASKEHLEGLLGERIELFAYPNGVPRQDYAEEHVRMVRECGFTAAVSTAWGSASSRSDRFQLPRFTPWDRSRLRYGTRLLWNLRHAKHATA